MEARANKVLKAKLGQEDQVAKTGKMATLVKLESKARQALEDLREIKDQLETKDLRAHSQHLVSKDPKVHRVFKVLQGLPENLA